MVSVIFCVNVSATSGGNSPSISTCTGEWLPVASICRLSSLQLPSLPAGLCMWTGEKTQQLSFSDAEKPSLGFTPAGKERRRTWKEVKGIVHHSPENHRLLSLLFGWTLSIHPSSIQPSMMPQGGENLELMSDGMSPFCQGKSQNLCWRMRTYQIRWGSALCTALALDLYSWIRQRLLAWQCQSELVDPAGGENEDSFVWESTATLYNPIAIVPDFESLNNNLCCIFEVV